MVTACDHWLHLSVISILAAMIPHLAAADDVLSRERAENPRRRAEQFLPVNVRTAQYTEGLKSLLETPLFPLAFITN